MFETINLSQWPLEVLQAVNHSLDLGIKEERDSATMREDLVRETCDPSQTLLDLWVADIERSRGKLESLIEAKAAILGALRIVQKDSKAIMN